MWCIFSLMLPSACLSPHPSFALVLPILSHDSWRKCLSFCSSISHIEIIFQVHKTRKRMTDKCITTIHIYTICIALILVGSIMAVNVHWQNVIWVVESLKHVSPPGWVSSAAPEGIRDATANLRSLLRSDHHQQRDRRHHPPAGGGCGPGVHHCPVGPRLLGLLTSTYRPYRSTSTPTWMLKLWAEMGRRNLTPSLQNHTFVCR